MTKEEPDIVLEASGWAHAYIAEPEIAKVSQWPLIWIRETTE